MASRHRIVLAGTLVLGLLGLSLACSGGGGGAVGTNPTATPPTLTSQPQSLTVKKGDAATFAVTATGSPAPTYQWRKAGTAIPGATGASLSLSNVQPSDDASYDVEVSNSAGRATSSPAVLTVQFAPVIVTQPAPATVPAGSPASFVVKAEGKPAPTYQWKRNGTPISGATAATYTIDKTVPGDDGYLFSVEVFNGLGTVTSGTAKLTVETGGLTSYTVTFVPSAGGSITGNLSQVVTPGGSTTPVKAAATSGYTFNGWTGMGGDEPFAPELTLTDVRKSMTITADFGNAQPGQRAANIVGMDQNGKRVSLWDQRGKVILLDLSAGWCGPCQAVGPLMQSLQNAYAGKPMAVVTCLAQNTSAQNSTLSDLQAWAAAHKLSIRVMGDEARSTDAGPWGWSGIAWGVYVKQVGAVPCFAIIDKDFKVQYLKAGFSEAAIRAKIDELLAK